MRSRTIKSLLPGRTAVMADAHPGGGENGSSGSDATGALSVSRSQILPSAQLKALIEQVRGMRHLAGCTSGGACAEGCPRRSTEFMQTIRLIKRQQILRQHLRNQKTNAPTGNLSEMGHFTARTKLSCIPDARENHK